MVKKIFSNILLVDGSEESSVAVETAGVLAKATGARVTVTDVREEFSRKLQAVLTTLTPLDLNRLLDEAQDEALTIAAKRLKAVGVRAEARALSGKPFIRIIQEVVRKKYDLVMKAAEGGGVRNVIFGSTDMHLLRKCPCPVWITGPGGGPGIQSIMAAVNTDPFDGEGNGFNEKILSFAAGLARMLGSQLHVAHAWTFLPETVIRARSVLTEQDLEGVVEETRLLHEKRFEEFLDGFKLGDVDVIRHVVKGDASVVIPELVRRRKVDLIVMGTIARTGVPGFFIGNTAERMLGRVGCSVLAVKPDGFVTPVKR